jgi:hypothetical protein
MGGGKIKESCGGGEFKYILYIVRTFVHAKWTPTQHNKKKRKKSYLEP